MIDRAAPLGPDIHFGRPFVVASAMVHAVVLAGLLLMAAPVRTPPSPPPEVQLVLEPAPVPFSAADAVAAAPADVSPAPPAEAANPPAAEQVRPDAAERADPAVAATQDLALAAPAPPATAPAAPEAPLAAEAPELSRAVPPPAAEPVPVRQEAVARPAPPPRRRPRPNVPTAGARRETAEPQALASPPSAPPSPVPAPRATPPAVTAAWQSQVAAWLEQHKRYPPIARERGEEGAVGVRIRIMRDGRVVAVQVPSSSGSSSLDRAALAMLDGQTLPPFLADMPEQEREVSFTIRYRIER